MAFSWTWSQPSTNAIKICSLRAIQLCIRDEVNVRVCKLFRASFSSSWFVREVVCLFSKASIVLASQHKPVC